MRLRKEIVEADNILDSVSRSIPFSVINPTNEQKIKTDFLKGKIKNPVLEYKEPAADLLSLRRKASQINLQETDKLSTLIVEKQYDVIRKIDLISSVGCFDFTDKSKRLYGTPDKNLVSKAYLILDEKYEKKPTKKMLSKDAVKLLRQNFKKYGLKYKILKENLAGTCSVDAAGNTIKLKKKARFSKKFMNKLVVHEIGTHVFRFENGAEQKLKVFSHGLPNHLVTEEGLALYNEEQFGLRSSLKNVAGRVIAVHMAQSNDFQTVFKHLKKYFDKKMAFQLTMRAKRGLANTSLVGGYTKDLVYLKGYFEVKRFVEKGGKIEDLYVGKVGINDLPFLESLKLKKPKFLPKDFDLVEY